MPLVPPVTPAEVESIGALTPQLLQVADQTSLDTFVQAAIDFADAWMQAHLGTANYGLTQFTWQVELQRRGQMYLALEAITDTLKARKIYGTHSPYMSEESPAYEALIDNEWGIRGIQCLDLWVTLESATRHFALPIFATSAPINETDAPGTGLDPLELQYADLLDRARGLSIGSLGSVTR